MAKAAPNDDMSLIWLPPRLQSRYVNNKRNKKASIQTTHISVVSVVLVAKDAPNADMSLILFPQRLQRRCVNNCVIKKTDNLLKICQRGVGGRSQR